MDSEMGNEMDIKNPRRLLAVGAPDSGVLSLLKGKYYHHLVLSIC